MRSRLLMMIPVLISMLVTGASADSLPEPMAARIVSFKADKLLYDTNQPVTFQVKFQLTSVNPSLQPSTNIPVATGPYQVEVWDQQGLANAMSARKVASAAVKVEDLKEGMGTATLSWTPPTDQTFGHLAVVKLVDRFGRVLAEDHSLYEVVHHWQYAMRYAATIAYNLVGSKLTEADIRRAVDSLRDQHVNAVELFAWMPSPYKFTWDKPTWHSAYYRQPNQPLISSAKILLLSKLLHEQGMKLIMYNESSVIEPSISLKGKDAEAYRVYADYDGHGPKLLVEYPISKETFVPNALKVADLFEEQLAESVKLYGWDGILMDSGTQFFYNTAMGTDKNGKQLTDLTAGQVGERYLGPARKAVHAINPEFVFICQNVFASVIGRSYHWRAADDKMPDVIGDYYRKTFGGLENFVDAWSSELDTHYDPNTNYPQTYRKYALGFNIMRYISGKPVLNWSQLAHPDDYTPAYTLPLISTLAASRTSWNDHFGNYGGMWGPWAAAPVNQAQSQINRFVMRFGQYLRAPDLKWMPTPETSFAVSGPKDRDLMWSPLVYHRSNGNGQQWVLNVLNLDTDYVRPSNVKQPPHKLPPPAFPVTVTFTVPAGIDASAMRVFVANAEDASLQALQLHPDAHDGKLVITLPPVRDWSMVVLEAPKGGAQ